MPTRIDVTGRTVSTFIIRTPGRHPKMGVSALAIFPAAGMVAGVGSGFALWDVDGFDRCFATLEAAVAARSAREA